MPYQCQQVHTNTPGDVVGIVEPWTPGLTARSSVFEAGFLLSATNTSEDEDRIKGQNPMCWFSPKCHGHTQEQEIEIR